MLAQLRVAIIVSVRDVMFGTAERKKLYMQAVKLKVSKQLLQR